jgi:hypothetical protein
MENDKEINAYQSNNVGLDLMEEYIIDRFEEQYDILQNEKKSTND